MSDIERLSNDRLLAMLVDHQSRDLLSEHRPRLRDILAVLLRRGPSLPNKSLLLIITDFASALEEEQRWGVCSILLQRLPKLASAELFTFYRVCSDPDERPKILHELIRRRDGLKTGELVELLMLTCPKTSLSRECRQTLTELKLRSQDDARQEHWARRSLFGLSVSADDELVVAESWSLHEVMCNGCKKQSFTGGRYRCTVCTGLNLCDSCNQRVCSGAALRSHTAAHPVEVVHLPLQLFPELRQADTTLPRRWHMDIRFSKTTQTRLSSIMTECLHKKATPGRTDATLSLVRDLPVGTGAKVYVSISPFDSTKTHYIGALLPEHPFLPLEWARLLYHFWAESRQELVIQTIRLGIALGDYGEVKRKRATDRSVLTSVGSFSTPTGSSSAASLCRPSVEKGVVVCRGDVQRFSITPKTTFDDVLEKATNCWGGSRLEHKLQDEEFSTFDSRKPASSARGVIRYV